MYGGNSILRIDLISVRYISVDGYKAFVTKGPISFIYVLLRLNEAQRSLSKVRRGISKAWRGFLIKIVV